MSQTQRVHLVRQCHSDGIPWERDDRKRSPSDPGSTSEARKERDRIGPEVDAAKEGALQSLRRLRTDNHRRYGTKVLFYERSRSGQGDGRGGAGLLSWRRPDGAMLEAISISAAQRGPFQDQIDAHMLYGRTADNRSVRLEGGVFRATYALARDQDGVRAGATASAAEGAITVGTVSKESDRDEQVRLGLSFGVACGGRIHWGDSDGDGAPEYGFGFDAGPVSFDLKTESWRHTLFPALRAVDQAEQALAKIRADLEQRSRGTGTSTEETRR